MKQTQSYIICATPRSGSTLMCDLLDDTGIAGHPDSFFRCQSIPWWAQHLNVSITDWADEHGFDQSYLAAVLKHGAGKTQMFGMRLMWKSVDGLSKRLGALYPDLPSDSCRFRSAFGPPIYVHLSREDKVAQAVSRLRAEQTGLWHVAADGTERERLKPALAPIYNARDLSEQVAELEEHDAAWLSWFTEQKIQAQRVTYEALSANPQSALATVLAALGLDPAIAETAKPRTAKMADNESREWATRFRVERRSPLT